MQKLRKNNGSNLQGIAPIVITQHVSWGMRSEVASSIPLIATHIDILETHFPLISLKMIISLQSTSVPT